MKPNVAVLTKTISRKAGGLFASVRRLSQSMCQVSDVDVQVFALRDEFTERDVDNWAPLPTHVFDAVGPKSFGYSRAMKRTLMQSECNIAHVHGLWTYPSIGCLAWHNRTRSPYVISPRGMIDPWAIANSRLKKRVAGWLFENRHLHRAACLHALCQSEAESMRSYGLKNPIAVIPNGIDLPTRRPSSAGDRQPPWGPLTGGRNKVLLFLSRIHPKKGLLNFLRGWQRAQLSEWVLVIAGWDQGGHEDELKRTATELGIAWRDSRNTRDDAPTSASVVFVGPQFGADKETCYAHCDAFVLPSLSEGLPMVILEAWAHGKPVLMTRQCNLPEGFSAGAAWEIGHEPEDVARSLGGLATIPEAERLQIGCRGRALVEARYTWAQVSHDMAAVYRWLLGDGPKPACVNL